MKRLIWILIFAFVLAMGLRMFVLESFRMESYAMAGQQEPGNRLLVEKWTLGARMPQSIKWPFHSGSGQAYLAFFNQTVRTPGLSQLKRDELVVFNNPQSPKEMPVNQRPVLLSRCVALPGDYVQLNGYHLLINKKEHHRSVETLLCFWFPASGKKAIEHLVKYHATERDLYQKQDTGFIFFTRYEYLKLINDGFLKNQLLRLYKTTYDHVSTLVPYKGLPICLNDCSYRQWGKLINAYEGVSLKRLGKDKYALNGKESTFYTFRQDYYWVLNDHQGFLNDSRTMGPIPFSHIIGNACLLLFSPRDKRFLQRISN